MHGKNRLHTNHQPQPSKIRHWAKSSWITRHIQRQCQTFLFWSSMGTWLFQNDSAFLKQKKKSLLYSADRDTVSRRFSRAYIKKTIIYPDVFCVGLCFQGKKKIKKTSLLCCSNTQYLPRPVSIQREHKKHWTHDRSGYDSVSQSRSIL